MTVSRRAAAVEAWALWCARFGFGPESAVGLRFPGYEEFDPADLIEEIRAWTP